jgi:predicted transcriptional regulator
MKYRSQTEIYARILESAMDGMTRTQIMFDTFLEWARLKDYLYEMTTIGMLVHDVKKEHYSTTKKGMSFVKFYKLGEYLPLDQTQKLPETSPTS